MIANGELRQLVAAPLHRPSEVLPWFGAAAHVPNLKVMAKSRTALSIVILASVSLGLFPGMAGALSPDQGATAGNEEVEISLPEVTFASVAAGGHHSLGLSVEGSIYSWGENLRGQLGNGSSGAAPSLPGPISSEGFEDGYPRFVSIAAGGNHSLAVTDDGSIYAWGNNQNGQIGNGESAQAVTAPTLVDTSDMPADDPVVQVSAGNAHSLALTRNGQVWAWGSNQQSQLGVVEGAGVGNILTPARVISLEGHNIVHVYAGQMHTLAIDDRGELFSWGWNSNGQLGNGTAGTNHWEPQSVGGSPGDAGFEKWIAVGAGFTHTIGLRENSGLFAWGDNSAGELGTGATSVLPEDTPVPVTSDGVLAGKTVVALAAGSFHSIVMDDTGHAFSWGQGTLGQLGNGGWGDSAVPVAVAYGGVFSPEPDTDLSDGESHTITVTNTGEIRTWGWNNNGQLGTNTPGNANTPQEIWRNETITVDFGGAASPSVERQSLDTVLATTPGGCGVVEVAATQTILGETRPPISLGEFTFGVAPTVVGKPRSSGIDAATSTVTLNVDVADGADPEPVLQWQARPSQTNGEWAVVTGVTDHLLKSKITTSTDFRVSASNCVGATLSDPITVTVDPAKPDTPGKPDSKPETPEKPDSKPDTPEKPDSKPDKSGKLDSEQTVEPDRDKSNPGGQQTEKSLVNTGSSAATFIAAAALLALAGLSLRALQQFYRKRS